MLPARSYPRWKQHDERVPDEPSGTAAGCSDHVLHCLVQDDD